jgi:outer membrane protein assembly factor BamB
MGNLFCLKRSNGKIVWSKDFLNDFSGVYPLHGFSEAPSVDENKVFWTPGGKEHNVVALNRFNGDLLWSCKGMGEYSGYNPGNIIELPMRKIFVTFSAYHLMGIDTETGELLWSHLQNNTPPDKREPGIGDTHCNGIIFEDGFIYYAAGDGNCGVKLQLSDDGTTINEIWRQPDFDGYMGGIVKLANSIYGCGTAKKELKSINASTGITTDSLKIGTGALIAADDKLFYYNQRGQLSLVSYNSGKMKQENVFRITRGSKEHFSHPVIKNGILYQRHGDSLMAFDIRNKT